MKKKLLFGTALLLAACGTAKIAIAPSQTDVERVKDKYPGYTLAELNEGKTLYENNCNLCHGLKNPKSESEAEWNRIVPIMAAKVNKKEGHHLSETDQTKILRYVVTMGSAEKQ